MLEYLLTIILIIIIGFSLSRLFHFRVKGTVILILILVVAFLVAAWFTLDLGSEVIKFFKNFPAMWDTFLRSLNLK